MDLGETDGFGVHPAKSASPCSLRIDGFAGRIQTTHAPPIDTHRELEKKYGLHALPESVLRPTRLVTRQDADLEQIGKVIELDPVLTQCLLRSANPSASYEDD